MKIFFQILFVWEENDLVFSSELEKHTHTLKFSMLRVKGSQGKGKGKICIEYSDVTNYNCNRRGLLTIKGNPAFRQVNKRGDLLMH